MTKILTLEHVKEICLRLAREWMSWDEPIPDFETRLPNILESCLAAPLQTYGRKSLYPNLSSKAAALFYFLIKNHPFQNGNKRIAVTSLLVFLYLNGKWLKVSCERLYKIAVWVAESDREAKDGVTLSLSDIIRKHMVSLG